MHQVQVTLTLILPKAIEGRFQ